MKTPNKRYLPARRLPTFFKGLCSTAAASTALFAGHSAFAQMTATYTNGAATSNFATPANWSTGVVPGNDGTTATNSPDTAIFPTAILTGALATVTVDANRNVANITFDQGSPTTNTGNVYTLNGGPLLLSAGGTTQVIGGSTATGVTAYSQFACAITLEGNYTFLNNSANSGSQLRVTNTIAPDAALTAASPVTFTLGGTGPGTINLQNPITNGTGGSVLSVVKMGAGAASLNGVNTFTGGVTIQQGSVGLGNSAGLGTGTLTLGSAATGADAMVTAGSNYTIANAINVGGGAGARTIGNNGGSNQATFSGAITLNNNAAGLTISSLTAASTGRNLTISGGITGMGNVTVANTNLGSTIISTNPLNNVGTVSNTGIGTGTLSQTAGGTLGSNVTSFIQNSATSATTFSLVNTYGTTTVSAGMLTVAVGSTLGTGNVTVSGTSTLTLVSTTALADTAILNFANSSTIALGNGTGDTLFKIVDANSPSTLLAPGTYSAAQLDMMFGNINTFTGTGALTVTAVPEPSAWVGISVLAGAYGFLRRRRANARMS